MTKFIIFSILLLVVMIAFSPTRVVLAEIWKELLKPFLLKQIPRLVHWLIEAHYVILKNLFPRAIVVKTIKARYQSKDRK